MCLSVKTRNLALKSNNYAFNQKYGNTHFGEEVEEGVVQDALCFGLQVLHNSKPCDETV